MKLYALSTFLLFFSTLSLASSKYDNRFQLYNSIEFNDNPIDQDVFNLALKGYDNLVLLGKVKNPDILSVIDYRMHSREKRFWIFDLKNQSVLFNEWVAHGKYTGDAFASRFSNRVSSKQSSLGFFITGKTYDGKHKFSLKLHGQESRFNSNAFQRGIVIHGADYVSKEFISNNNKLGRSYGCPAIRQEIKYDLINTIKNGSCLFSYYPSTDYLSKSLLIN